MSYQWARAWESIAWSFLRQIPIRVEEIDEDKWRTVCHSKI